MFSSPQKCRLYPGDPFFLLILWSCKLTYPSIPTLLFPFGPPLAITSNLWFILGPSPFHSFNLCLYPTTHSSRHLIYVCIRSFPSSPSPVSVCTRAISVSPSCLFIRIILSLFTFSNICLYRQHHSFDLSISPCLFPDHHLLDISVLCLYLYHSLPPLSSLSISEPSSPNPLCTMFFARIVQLRHQDWAAQTLFEFRCQLKLN